MKWGVLQYCVIRPVYAFPVTISRILYLTFTQDDPHRCDPRLRRLLLRVLVVASLGPRLDCYHYFDIRHHCHVLPHPVVPASLQGAEASPSHSEAILGQGSWYADILLPSNHSLISTSPSFPHFLAGNAALRAQHAGSRQRCQFFLSRTS